MDGKEKNVSDCFEDYKSLPPRMRAEVITTARKLLEIQKETRRFLDSAAEPSARGDGKKRR